MKKENLCVVIVTYKRESLFNLLKSLNSQTVLPKSVLIVDNDPNSAFEIKLKEKKYNYKFGILYFKQDKNFGPSHGYNFGIKKAYEKGFDYIYTLDDDIIMHYKCLEKLFEKQTILNNSILVSLISSPNGIVEKIHHKILDSDLNQSPFIENDINYKNLDKKYYELDANSSCGLLLNRNVIEQIGYPDEKYFIWYDDLEYTYRISRKFKIILVVESVIFHFDQTYFLKNQGEKRIKIENIYKVYYGIRNSILFKLSYLPKHKKKYFIIKTFFYVIKIIFFVIINREDNVIKRIKVILLGFLDGIRNIRRNRYLPE